jgi:hypothetical protein
MRYWKRVVLARLLLASLLCTWGCGSPWMSLGRGGGREGSSQSSEALTVLDGSFAFIPNEGMARYFEKLPDGGPDVRTLGIFLGSFPTPAPSPCSDSDAGAPFFQGLLIKAFSSSGLADGGVFSFATPRTLSRNFKSGAAAVLSLYGDGGYLALNAVAGSGTLSLQPIRDGGVTATFQAALLTPFPLELDGGALSGSISVPLCP